MASKRAASDGEELPPGRRLRVTPERATSSPGKKPWSPVDNPEPPPTPRSGRHSPRGTVQRRRKKGRRRDDSSQNGRLERELEEVRQTLGEVRDILDTFLGAFLREQESIKGLFHALISKMDNMAWPSHNHCNHERLVQETRSKGKDTTIRLSFLSEIKPPVYHEDEIKSIRIGIFDGNTMIESGPLSNLKVEVMALEGSFPYDARGSWTPKEFHEHIASGRDGKGDVLAGKGTNAQLINGECRLDSIRFREGSCRARNGMFIIGARVCDGQAIGVRVQEAVMNPVVVQDRRNKSNEKSHPPNLEDGVYRLEKIAINGKYRKRLEEENISTVEHFLKALHKDEENLARILQIKKKCKDWDKMVKHAQECRLEGKPELKSYRYAERNVVLFFNYVHHLVGAKFGGRYIASEMFEPAQKNLVDKLKKDAYDQMDCLTEDHIMRDNIPVPISMNTEGGVGPSCMTTATQQNNCAHQGVTPATEVLSPNAPPMPLLHDNANNAYSPNSSFADLQSRHNYQACNTQILQNVRTFGSIPPVQGLSHGLNESPFAIANTGLGPGFSIPGQDQGAGLALQEQHFSAVLNDQYLDPLVAQDFSSGITAVSDMHLFVNEEDDGLAFLQPQAHINNWVAPGSDQGGMQSQVDWPGNGALEASASAHINTPQLLRNTGAPGSTQGSMQN